MTSWANDFFSLTPLGAGKEVGRSCFYCKYQRAGVRSVFLLDCGINPSISEDNAQSDVPALPFFDLIDEPLDYILITHFHNDHVSGLPFLINSYRQNISHIPPIYMTRETQDIMFLNLKDYAASGKLFHHIAQAHRKQTCDAVLDLLRKSIRTLAFNEFVKLKNNVSLTIYPAGHVLGAAMFFIEIAGFSLLYTGDWSIEKDLSLKQAELPLDLRPDLLITEGTYGTLMHTERGEREQKLIKACVDTLLKDGRVLLPVFAVGRVQELLRILDNHWRLNPDLQKYEIYYISSIGKNFSKDEQFVKHEKDSLMITRNVPCIIFATPGMLQQGVSRQLFEELCGYEKNLLLITGYGADGSYLHSLIQRLKVDRNILIKKRDGTQQQLKMRLLEISFSAHSDLAATMTLIETVRPKNLCLIHGSHGALEKLEARLRELYTNGVRKIYFQVDHPDVELGYFDDLAQMQIFVPDNGETLKFPIKGSIQAQYASEQPFDVFLKGFDDNTDIADGVDAASPYTDETVYATSQTNDELVIDVAHPLQPRTVREFYVQQSGIEFSIVDRPASCAAQFRATLGCDVQLKLRVLQRKLCAMFGTVFVTQSGSQFEVFCGLLAAVSHRLPVQFDIITRMQECRYNPTDEAKKRLAEVQGEQMRIALFRNGNSRLAVASEEDDGYYCEVASGQRAQRLYRLLIAKLVGKYVESTRIKAQDVMHMIGAQEAENGAVAVQNIIARYIDAYWHIEDWRNAPQSVIDAVMDVNLVSLVDTPNE